MSRALVIVNNQPPVEIRVGSAPGPRGIQGIPGSGGANFELNQSSASLTWVIAHNFGFKPNIQVTDVDGEEMVGYVRTDSIDLNTTTLTWPILVAGRAFAS